MTENEVASNIADLEGSIATLDIWLWIFGAFVAIGVVGETVFGITHLMKDATLRRLRQVEAQLHDKEVGYLHKTTEELRGRNLTLESEVLKLQAAASWREFSQEGHDKLVSLMKGVPHPPGSSLFFDSVVGNPEAKRYGSLLAKALSDAIGSPIDEPRGLSTCLECTGVWVCVNKNATAEIPEYGKAIRGALESVGVVGAQFCDDPANGQGSPTTIKIIVGPKE